MGISTIPQPGEPSYTGAILDFITEGINEAEAFLKAMPGYANIEKSKRMIHGQHSNVLSGGSVGGLSTVEANHFSKAATQLVSGMTDTRPFWEYRTFNKSYDKQTQIFGKLALHLWLNHNWDMRWADGIRSCCTGGSTYLHQTWNDHLQHLDLHAEDVRDVLPIRPNDYHTIQTAFGVILRRNRTVNYLKSEYPEFADLITPDRDGGATGQNENTRYARLMEKLGSPFWNSIKARQQPARDIPRIPTADEFHVYLDDERIHEGREPLYMGNWHTAPVEGCRQCLLSGTPHALNNWSYIVQRGDRVYPNKRLIIATSKLVLYDNTSIYWHGLYPFPKLTLDPWEDTFIGKGLVWDAMPMQKFLDRWLRLIDNHMQKWQQPDLMADKNSTSQSEFNKINTARPGLKMRFNPIAGKGPELRYPDPLPQYLVDVGKFAIEEIGELTGARSMGQLANLNQLPAADTVERLMEAMTPEVRLRSRILEAFTREFAMITASNIAQFMTFAQRLAILGPDGATQEDFDYDPGSLIPDYVHADDFDEGGRPTPEAIARGPLPRRDRAKEFLRQTSMHIAPGSLLNASEITDKLMYLTLAREGIIDPQTLADKMGIPNWGEIPGKTILEKLTFMSQAGLGMQQGVGRPPSGQQMPQASARPDGSGVKVSESG